VLRNPLYSPLDGKWSTPSAFAAGTLSFNGNVTEGPPDEAVLIGETIYQFVNVETAPHHVRIGTSASQTIGNLVNAVNSTHPDVTAVQVPGKMNVTAKVPGAAGNSIATLSTAPNATWDAATLQGGT
jgi:hypothetical protein